MLARAACGLGIGLVAGFVGTAAITASQLIEMRLRGRKPSKSPVKAVSKVFEIHPDDERAEDRLNTLAHWGYGTSWGAVRGIMTAFGFRGPWADVVHWGAVQGTALVMLPGLKVAPPVREWGVTEIVIEGVHHAVYATAVGLTSDALCRRLGAEQPATRLPLSLLAGGAVVEGLRRSARRARPPEPLLNRVPEPVRQGLRDVTETVTEALPVALGRRA